jgi:hypothetical protein
MARSIIAVTAKRPLVVRRIGLLQINERCCERMPGIPEQFGRV